LEADFRKMRDWAERLGVPAAGFPGLVMASGASLQHRRARFSNTIVVMVPKGARNRSAIRKEAHRAMARALIDGLREDCPARFAAMAGVMDASFQETNNLLFRYLAAEDGASKLALSLQINFFGYVSAPRGRLHKVPERLGVAGFGDDARRKSWEDEAVALLAEAQGKGWDKLAESQGKARRDAARAEKLAMRRYLETRSLFDRFTGKRRRMRKLVLQAGQARQLCEEAERKTAMLRTALQIGP
jgi:hypothetical protein